MRTDFLDILVDPYTRKPLTLQGAVYKGDEIDSGILHAESDADYPVINGIPRFVKKDNYTASFGLQWNRFARTQLDSATGRNYSRLRFETEVGWNKDWAEGKWILDAGCGAGRFLEIAAESGCRLVAMDMSGSIDAAKENLRRFSNIDYVQADLFNMPFKSAFFNGFYCIGVLQHSPDPYAALRHLLDVIGRKGRFACTIYARRPWTKLYAKYWARRLTAGLPEDKLLGIVEKVMPAAFPVTDILFRLPYLGKLARFVIPVANYVEKKDMTRQQRYEEAILDTFDMLSPKYDNPVKVQAVREALLSCGINEYTILTRHPLNIRGKK